MRAHILSVLAACFVLVVLLISTADADTSDLSPSSAESAGLFVIPQGSESEVRLLLPENMKLDGLYSIGDISIEESSILVEFNAAQSQSIKIRLGHPAQQRNAWRVSEKFAFIVESGDSEKQKTAFESLFSQITRAEKDWLWKHLPAEKEDSGSRSDPGKLPPVCIDALQALKNSLEEGMSDAELLQVFERSRSAAGSCEAWFLIEIVNRGGVSIVDAATAAAEKLSDDSAFDSLIFAIASNFKRHGYNEKALEMLDRLAVRNPSFTRTAAPLANLNIMLGYRDNDILRYAERLERNPSDAVSDMILGFMKYYRRDYAGALPHFERCAELEALRREAAVFLVMCNHFLDRKSEAARLLNAFMQEKERSHQLYYCRAALFMDEKPDQALQDLRMFIESHGIKLDEAPRQSQPDVKDAWYLMEYIRQRRLDPGVEIFRPFDMQAPWPPISVISLPRENIRIRN